jgi:hypothetical protein
MAEIVNDNIGLPGTVTSGADMDAKFDNARQASLTLNEKNVRSEGIDRRNLEGYSYPSGRVEPVVYMDKVDNNDRQFLLARHRHHIWYNSWSVQCHGFLCIVLPGLGNKHDHWI